MPTKPRSVAPLFFSMISCTSRTKVRSISDADINCAFSRRFAWRFEVRGDMNAASYACRAVGSKAGQRDVVGSFEFALYFDFMPTQMEAIRAVRSANSKA